MKLVIQLEVVEGPQLGQTADVVDSPFVVGSGGSCDWRLDDVRLGRKHFEIVVLGQAVQMTAAGSDGPVWINGMRQGVEPLVHGDRIRAGSNIFQVHIVRPGAATVVEPSRAAPAEASPPATSAVAPTPVSSPLNPAPAEAPPKAKAEAQGKTKAAKGAQKPAKKSRSKGGVDGRAIPWARRSAPLPVITPPAAAQPVMVPEAMGLFHLGEAATRPPMKDDDPAPRFAPAPLVGRKPAESWLGGQPARHAEGLWYGLVDAARDAGLAFGLAAKGYDLVSLFLGPTACEVVDAAPYFFSLRPQAAAWDDWHTALGGSAGVLFDGPVDAWEMFQHLRSIFVVADETGQEHFFRYYDPRVLRVFLPTCKPDELKEFFGPIHSFLVENAVGDGWQQYAIRPDGALECTALEPADFKSSALPSAPTAANG